jgi:hypothetical protein
MRKIYWFFIFLFSIVKAQVKVVDLSTGRYEDGSVMPIDVVDPDWTYTRPDGSEHKTITRHTYSGWYLPAYSDNTYNDRWITGEPGDPTEGYFIYKSKTFVVPEGAKANLEVRALAFVRQWTYLVKKDTKGKEDEKEITRTVWMNDGAKGWFNSRNPLVELDLTPGTYYIKVKVYTNNGNVRQSLNVASKVYISPSDEKDYTIAPNSYIFDIDKAKKENLIGISIPVKKAFAVWEKNEYFKDPIPDGKLSASVYWEDIYGLINKDVELISAGNREESKIKVKINSYRGKGNAVIALHVGPKGNSSDPVYWSWHIWVTDDPTKEVKVIRSLSGDETVGMVNTYMDRNLGALSNTFLGEDWHRSGGLMYQWGRKDPFPVTSYKDSSFPKINSIFGDIDNWNYRELLLQPRPYESSSKNIKSSVQHPLTLYKPLYNEYNIVIYKDTIINGILKKDTLRASPHPNHSWFTNDLNKNIVTTGKMYDLWGSNTEGKKIISHSQKNKTPFDPCPSGWRVPSFAYPIINGVKTNWPHLSPWGKKPLTITSIDDKNGKAQLNYGDEFFTLKRLNNPVLVSGLSIEQKYKGIKAYPGLGIDFSNVKDFDFGMLPLNGHYVNYYNYKSGLLYQDERSEVGLWSATLNQFGIASMFYAVLDTVTHKYRFNASEASGGNTSSLNAIRCTKDEILDSDVFKTEYLTDEKKFYVEGIDNPNSYIVKEGQKDLKIPVSKAFSMYNQYFSNREWPKGNLSANVYWTTNKNLITSVTLQGNNENAFIKVGIDPKQKGNAIISLHIGENNNSSDPVYWSWHVWVPNGDPEAKTYTHVTTSLQTPIEKVFASMDEKGMYPIKTEFMSRVLGAIEEFPLELKDKPKDPVLLQKAKLSGGLHYQWGRKDPIPTFMDDQQTIYLGTRKKSNGNINYSSLISSQYNQNYTKSYSTYTKLIGINKNDSDYNKITKIYKYSVNYPLNYLYNEGKNVQDWISDKNAMEQNRWGHGDKKSPFDPCPAGWRVPDFSFISPKVVSPWYNGAFNRGVGIAGGGIKSGFGGVPVSDGVIFHTADYSIGGFAYSGIRGSQGKYTGLWTSVINSAKNFDNHTYTFGLPFAAIIDFQKGLFNTAELSLPAFAAANVQCAKDVSGFPIYDGSPINKNVYYNENVSENMIINNNSEIHIYPNPNSGLFTIKLENLSEGTIQIMDINGSLVYSKNIKNKEFEVNIQEQPAGIYFIQVKSGKKIITKKIIKN